MGTKAKTSGSIVKVPCKWSIFKDIIEVYVQLSKRYFFLLQVKNTSVNSVLWNFEAERNGTSILYNTSNNELVTVG